VSLVHRVATGLRDRATAATTADVTAGDRAVLVTLSHPDHGRLAGLAHRPHTTDTPRRSAWPTSAATLAALATADSSLERAVGVATLNALSVPDVDWRVGDPMAALSPAVDVDVTVGLFRPAFRKFDDVTVRVVERDPPPAVSVDTPDGVTVTTHAPADRAAAFADADCCFLTGSTLVYGGTDRYLDALDGVAPVVLVGATASHRPGPAFEAGVDLVAGARVVDPDRVQRRVRAGDCGTDLHGHGVEKVYVARRRSIPGLQLTTTESSEPRR